jgi:long-chain acyl-CoA synthetase
MLGYWRMADESRLAVDAESWLHTGDVAELRDGRIYLHGRLGESFALSTGHKIAPTIIEAAILRDPLFDQVMVTGEGKPFVAMLAVLDRERWRELAAGLGLEPDDPASLHDVQAHEEVGRLIGARLQGLPSYMHPRAQVLRLDPWTIDQGLMTPTLKLRRAMIAARHEEEIRALYLETSTEPVP